MLSPEHRATLTRLLAIVDSGVFAIDEARACAPALRAVLAEPEAAAVGDGWESAEDFANREAGVAATMGTTSRRTMIEKRDTQTADRLASIELGIFNETTSAQVRAFIRDLRGSR